MTGTHVPMRRCVGCRKVRPRAALRRFVRAPDGSVVSGPTAPGRGAWLCPESPGCAEAAIEHRAFERALKGPCRAPSVAELVATP